MFRMRPFRSMNYGVRRGGRHFSVDSAFDTSAATTVLLATMKAKGALPAIFWGGLLAGVLDLTQAFIGFSLMGSTPFRILQRIAGGIFGTHSRDMGWTSAAIGLVCHFAVAFGAATVYYVASRKLRLLVERPVLCGLFYGELVFLFMYFVVIPLSAIGHPQFNIATYLTGPIGHPLLVGLPIALCIRRFSAERPL